MPSPEEKEAAAPLAHLEGIQVDPVYRGKDCYGSLV
jgi:1-aminocyclopropane-1-carboxylate deaminase/D-cysteine desulfhydrase-like pyridoxal-dependent ACC family enzyme